TNCGRTTAVSGAAASVITPVVASGNPLSSLNRCTSATYTLPSASTATSCGFSRSVNCSTVCTDAGFGALGAVIGSCDEVVADVACGDCGVPRLTGEPRAV